MNREKKISIIIFIVFMILSIVITVIKTGGMLNERKENDERVVTGLISNAITNEFLRPITVAQTMSTDANLKYIMTANTRQDANSNAKDAAFYLDSIKKGFGYSMVYAVSDRSKAYYTCDGISRFVDDTLTSYDIWYKNFLDMGVKYDLDVDTDVENSWALSVFVNTAVYDDNNKLLGVCGIGKEMSQLQATLGEYEEIYDVKIDLIDRSGLVMIDTDTSKIEQESINVADLNNYADGECYYEIRDDGNRTITYLKDLDWFLVVQNKQLSPSYIMEMVAPNVICFVVGIICIVFVNFRKKKVEESKK